jgi:hypothetical protein
MEFTFIKDKISTPVETPGGTKRVHEGTPTPEFERRGGELAKKGRGEPIPMKNMDEPKVGQVVHLPRRTYAEVAMEKAQVDAMQVAPPWAKVILTVIMKNITHLGQVTTDLGASITLNDSKIKDLEISNKKLTAKVEDHQHSQIGRAHV